MYIIFMILLATFLRTICLLAIYQGMVAAWHYNNIQQARGDTTNK